MPRIEIPFTGSSRSHRSPFVANQRCINWFPEVIVDDQGKAKTRVLIGSPGKTLLVNVSANPCRALYMASTNYLKYWVVLGSTVYEFLPNAAFYPIGNLTTSQGPVYIADNGTHLCIVDGSPNGYYYQISAGSSSGWTKISDANFVGGDFILYMDGYFFVIQPSTNIIACCTAPNGTPPSSWPSGNVWSTALGDAGPLICMATINDLLWVFGDYYTSVFQNTSNSVGFPFSKIVGVDLNIGISARAAIKELNGNLIWPAKSRKGERFIVQTSSLGTYNRISTHELEYTIGKYPIVSDAYSDGYIEEGHSFYQLTYPTGNQTVVYDGTTGEWHERSSSGLGRDRAYGHIFFNGQHIVGDSTTGNLYTASLDTYTEAGAPLISTRRCQHLKKGRDLLEIPGIIVDCETGMISTIDPQMGLRYSTDGGNTWSQWMFSSMGQQGQYGQLVRFPRLGQAEDWVFEISISDPVKRTILGAYIDG